ncbi:alpha/beta hydrolase [Oxynema sp. CENA135]|uniref:alpha/beta fold hydrolase n=1 Tax=Oxynema sp. CENA135 TaxID=984206 RepID=UPI00190C96CB|nr:alpha/beta hydrolase [Oxynema sp. CENA135]
MSVRSQFLTFQNTRLHYLEVGAIAAKTVLFLHGASFKAQTWQELGTLQLLSDRGYRAIALDLPGYGESETVNANPQTFLLDCLDFLKVEKTAVVSPSMSGRFSLPFLVGHGDRLSAFVAIAPVGIPNFIEKLQDNPVPTLAVWGSNDRIVSPEQADLLVKAMSNARKVIFKDAGHACYMRATDAFHEELLAFLERYT